MIFFLNNKILIFHINTNIAMDIININIKEQFDYVFVSSILNKNSYITGILSIDHEVIIDLEDAIKDKNSQKLYEYIIMMEYSKKDFPQLIQKINLIIENIKTLF